MGRDPFSAEKTQIRPWDKDDSMETALRRVHVAFEFFQKLGVEFYCFHDVDVAPQGQNIKEFHENLDKVTDLMLDKQKETGIKLLWGTQNLFSHIRYKDGAATSPDVQVFAFACAQTQKMLEITHKLGGANHVFWGGREGFATPLNTKIRQELDQMAAFFRLVVAHKEKIGATFQLLIEPKPREPSTHQYDYDAQTVVSFLHTYNLQNHFKLNIEPNHTTLAGHDYEHDVRVASELGMLGSIDCNAGQPYLGWDTDEFPSDPRKALLQMLVVIKQGGIQPGGNNFDCKLRRESTDIEDMFIAHIGGMDALARGLLGAAKLIEKGVFADFVEKRYASWKSEVGAKILDGKATLGEIAQLAHNGEPEQISGKQEWLEQHLNAYI